MNVMRTIVALIWLTGLLPGMAQASDADRFVAASRTQQAELLTQWAAAPDAARLPLLQALQKENLYTDSKSTLLRSVMAEWFPSVKQRRLKGRPKRYG